MNRKYTITLIIFLLGVFLFYVFFVSRPKPYVAQILPQKTNQTAPIFSSRIQNLSATQIAKIQNHSWYEGCPVALADLRSVEIAHYGFDGKVHTGEIIVAEKVANDVVIVFQKLFDTRFPIEKMIPIDAYGGDDELSMADNNTSGFNCRAIAGSKSYSMHAYGLAIDINPKINPYVAGSTDNVYADRNQNIKGMIKANNVVVKAFASIGWEWGGDWKTKKDYQHFSINGK